MSAAAIPEQPTARDAMLPRAAITADADGVRVYFADTDRHRYPVGEVAGLLTAIAADYPTFDLDFVEFDGGCLFDFSPGER